MVVLGMAWVVGGRRHRSALDQVDREIAAGRYGAARQRLIGLSTRWMGPDEVDYRLGLCEGYLGHDEAALAAWGRLPARSPFAEAAALNSAAVEINRGRFSAAETILEGALGHPGRQVVTVGQVLARLLWEQGRTHERRAVIESSWRIASRPGWPRPEEALGLLRDHMAVDFESLAVDAFRTLLDRAGRQAPEDDRVWLGWANLAIRTGQFADARRRIDDCLRRRPEDPAVWQAELDWGLGTEQVAPVRRALAHLPAERFSREPGRGPPRLVGVPSPRRRDRAARARAVGPGRARPVPGAGAARRAGGPGRSSRAGGRAPPAQSRDGPGQAALRQISTIRITSPTMRRSSLGWPRPWAAGSKPIGFLTWITQRDPGDHAARTALARLQGEETPLGAPGQTLAQVLAADLAAEAGRPSAVAEPGDPRRAPVSR